MGTDSRPFRIVENEAFHLAPGSFFARQEGRDDPGIVDNQHVTRIQIV
jgi:hypothetical protein